LLKVLRDTREGAKFHFREFWIGRKKSDAWYEKRDEYEERLLDAMFAHWNEIQGIYVNSCSSTATKAWEKIQEEIGGPPGTSLPARRHLTLMQVFQVSKISLQLRFKNERRSKCQEKMNELASRIAATKKAAEKDELRFVLEVARHFTATGRSLESLISAVARGFQASNIFLQYYDVVYLKLRYLKV